MEQIWTKLTQTSSPPNKQKLHIFQRNIIDSKGIEEVDKVAFANIDVDLYEAVYSALHHVHKKLVLKYIEIY